MSFTCPLCHQPLTQINNSVICPQRHQFDVAKEGYINLLWGDNQFWIVRSRLENPASLD